VAEDRSPLLQGTPASAATRVRSPPEGNRITTQRRATQAEEKFCLFVANQLLALSAAEAPPALLYDVKAACSQVDFGAMESVCAVRGAKAGKVPRWLAEFVPLISELQQAVDAPRGRFPDRVRFLSALLKSLLNFRHPTEIPIEFSAAPPALAPTVRTSLRVCVCELSVGGNINASA
jgi:hypothetical protein